MLEDTGVSIHLLLWFVESFISNVKLCFLSLSLRLDEHVSILNGSSSFSHPLLFLSYFGLSFFIHSFSDLGMPLLESCLDLL